MKPKAAIYHFTDKCMQRPKIYKDQLKKLESYAISMGFEVAGIYCDRSLKRCERKEYFRFIADCDKYEILVTKDFYHIAKNTGRFMSDLLLLRSKGLQAFSIENGVFIWDEAPLYKPLRVATYTCHFGPPNEMKELVAVKNDVFKLFACKKTKWSIIDQYWDESLHQKDGEQVQMMDLIKNRDKYDVLLVHNLNDIHWRTANFCRIREQLKLDIFSLQEGFLAYR